MDAGKDTKKAQSALKAVKKGVMKKERKVRKSVIFHRPKTLTRDRDPMYTRKGCELFYPEFIAAGSYCNVKIMCNGSVIMEA